MTSTMEHAMGMNLNPANEQAKQGSGVSQAFSLASHDLDTQRLRILRCTAKAMASTPGGLRFTAGTRPWLDGLAGGRPALSAASSQRGNPVSQAAGD
jgi:hypothetical protein